MKICTNCGSQNKDGNIFCSSCGHKLENTIAPNYSQPNNMFSECQITFQRPQSFQMMVNIFHVKVDNGPSYELKNGGEIKIPVSPGQHTVEISVFGSLRKKHFQFHSTGNMTFICKPNFNAAITYWALPVKITDINGREY